MAGLFAKSPHLNCKFDLISKSDYDTIRTNPPKNSFPSFELTYDSYDEKQLEEAINLADIIVFQPLEDRLSSRSFRPPHACTDNLLSNFKGKLICAPNFGILDIFNIHIHFRDSLDSFSLIFFTGYLNKDMMLKNQHIF